MGGVAGASRLPPPTCNFLKFGPTPVSRSFLSRDVVWSGNNHTVVQSVGRDDGSYRKRQWYELWFDQIDGAGVSLVSQSIYSAYVQESPSGLATNVGSATVVGLEKTSNGYGVAWNEDNQSRLLFARIDQTGNMIERPIALGGDPLATMQRPLPADLVWNGSEFGLAWSSSESVWFALIDASGIILNRTLVARTEVPVIKLHLDWDAQGFVIVYEELLPMLDEVSLVRLDRAGTLSFQPVSVSLPSDRYTSLLWAGQSRQSTLVLVGIAGNGDSANKMVIREFDVAGAQLGSDTPVDPFSFVAAAFDGRRLGVVLTGNDVTSFSTLELDGRLGSQRIEVARSLTTSTASPTIGSLAARGDGFALFYATANDSTSTAQYATFLCPE